MSRVDLHVHSKYSNHPSEWFLQRIGTRESYTEVEELYAYAKQQGMDFVTICDHNTIEGAQVLHQLHPDDTFVSVEVTTYFPEDKCKIHVLVFDVTSEQFEIINAVRTNIYELQAYLYKENLACSVAHATYSVNRRLTLEIIEKLILLFDVFEGINGARNAYYNQILREVMLSLTPEDITRLAQKHNIEPRSPDPWLKGFTGGSDDHAGLFIGQTYTEGDCKTKDEFIQLVKDKRTISVGRTNDYKSFAFTIYKIAYDFSKQNASKNAHGVWDLVNSVLFEQKQPSFRNWIAMQKIKRGNNERSKLVVKFLDELVKDMNTGQGLSVDSRIDRMYRNIANLIDNFFVMLVESFSKDLSQGDTAKLLKTISATLPALFLSAPFITSLKHLYLDRALIRQLKKNFIRGERKTDKRILWFTDTFNDLNGVAVTLNNVVGIAQQKKLSVKFAVSVPEDSRVNDMKGVMNLESIYDYVAPFYSAYTMRFPSLLKSLERIYDYNPSEIIISTPGPIGLLGVAVAKLMGIRCVGIYHTDFTKQMDSIVGDDTLSFVMNKYIRWFYSHMDVIRVPTRQYISILTQRGYDESKMRVFPRGIDTTVYSFSESTRREAKKKYGIKNGFTLMWSGRVSKDKRVDFLATIYKKMLETHRDTNLVIAGDGPDLKQLQCDLGAYERVCFTGRVSREELIGLYSLADVFVFPSVLDTFGMVILEAQACRLPALVTDVGGPQEIIVDGKTGQVLPAYDLDQWVEAVREMRKKKDCYNEAYVDMCDASEKNISNNYSWNTAFQDIFGITIDIEKKTKEPQPLSVSA